MTEITLARGVTLRCYDDTRYVETRWPDGRACGGTRDATPANCAEVEAQGYAPDAEGCWQSLVDHEILHTVCAADLWPDGLSTALRHEAGDPRPYWARLHEEAVALACQHWINGQPLPVALVPYRDRVFAWRRALDDARAALGLQPAVSHPGEAA